MEYEKYGESFPICPEAAMEKWASPVHWPFWNEGRNQWMNDAGKAPSGAMNFYASRSTPVVGEVRPVNRAVRYLIRAR